MSELDEARGRLLGVLRGQLLLHDIGMRTLASYIGVTTGFAALAANDALTGADPYNSASILLLRRQAAYTGLCIDPDCDLSGNHEHMGECIPCPCPHRHAIDECPETRRSR